MGSDCVNLETVTPWHQPPLDRENNLISLLCGQLDTWEARDSWTPGKHVILRDVIAGPRLRDTVRAKV